MLSKKFGILILAIILLLATVLSACSKSSNDNNPVATPSETDSAAVETASPEKFKEMTIRILSWQFGPDNAYGNGYRAIADEYMKLHPEIKVVFVDQAYDGYINKLKANLDLGSETAIDIAQLQSAMIDELKNFGKLMDLTTMLAQKSAYSDEKSWFDSFIGEEKAFSQAKASNKFGHILFLPSDTNPQYFAAQPIVYNKKIFADAGVTSDPTKWTWSDFIENAKEIQVWGQENINPNFAAFASDKEHNGWTFGMPAAQMGADLFDEEFSKVDFSSEGSGLDPNAAYLTGDDLFYAKISYAITHGWLSYAGKMEQYYDDMLRLYTEFHGLIQKGFEQQTPAESSQLFYTEKAAMMQAQMADKNEILKNTEGHFEFGVFMRPMLTKENTEFASGMFPEADGQYKDGFGVNAAKVAKDPDRQAAVTDFLQYFMSIEAQNNYVSVANSFSPTKGANNPTDLMDWVFPMEAGKTSKEIYGYQGIEWAYGNWAGYMDEYIQGKKTAKQLLDATIKDSTKNVIEWYAAQPEAVQAQIDAKMEIFNGTQDEELKKILTEQINTLKISKVLFAQAVEEAKKQQ